MSRRPLLLLAAVVALGALNLWRWGAQPAARSRAGEPRAAALEARDFTLNVGAAGAEPMKSMRNLFQARVAPPPTPPKKLEQAKPEPLPGPPPKTPQELAEEAARAEIAQIKLVGVVFRGEQGQAFLVKGEQVYLVHAGGKVGDRFQVDAIAPDSIQLRDPATRVTGQIPVSGK